MKRKAIHNKDFQVNKFMRAFEQREAMKKNKKADKEKKVTETAGKKK